MKTKTILAAALLCGTLCLRAQEMPEMPKPTKQHEWLQKFAGEWESQGECYMEPGKEPMKSKGTESVRMLGGFWALCEGSGEAMGMPFANVLTVGYDPEKEKYVATWVDSMTGRLWSYEGAVDGNKLTLTTEGPCPMTGKHLKFREEIEFADADHKTFTSYVSEDGKTWTKAMRMTSVRKSDG